MSCRKAGIFAADEAELAADGTVDVQIVTDEFRMRREKQLSAVSDGFTADNDEFIGLMTLM